MVRGIRDHHGGIGSLRKLVEEYRGPITFELLKINKHVRDIGTEDLDWREFRFFVENLPPTPDNALFRAMYPKSWHWDINTDLLALILHATQGANWQRAGGREDDRPELLRRPSEGDDTEPPAPDEETFEFHDIRAEIARRQQGRG